MKFAKLEKIFTGVLALFNRNRAGHAADDAAIIMSDRGLPVWAKYLCFVFSAAALLCIIAVEVSTIFFQGLIAQKNDTFGFWAITLAALVPVIGYITLEFSHIKALAGYQSAQRAAMRGANAVLAVLICIALTLLHPLLGITIGLAALLQYCALWLAKRLATPQRQWDFTSGEAVAMLAGRDQAGFDMASQPQTRKQLYGLIERVVLLSTIVSSCAVASWLTAVNVLSFTAIPAVMICNFWAVYALSQYFTGTITDAHEWRENPNVKAIPLPDDAYEDEEGAEGLIVEGLSLLDEHNNRVLSNISFTLKLGSVLGILGEAGSGKSILAQALMNPHALMGLKVQGTAQIRGQSLWDRSIKNQTAPAVFVGPNPFVLPASGLDNLTCFQNTMHLPRARRCLENLLYSVDSLDQVMEAADATKLSQSQKRALGFARVFFIGPSLYVFDRPEDGTGEDLKRAVIEKIKLEQRAGRMVIIISEDRAMLELCNKIVVLQNGRVIESGLADEVRGRMSTGWARFVCLRLLESEAQLEDWMRAHFRRKGDEANRQKCCAIAAELLALSCQSAAGLNDAHMSYDFKHFIGHCILRITDQGSLFSTGQMEIAKREAQDGGSGAISPLAKILAQSLSFEQKMQDEKRVFTVKIETYDPRKNKPVLGGETPVSGAEHSAPQD